MKDAEASAKERNQSYIDMDDLLDDPDLQKIHEERIAQLQREAEKRAEMKKKGHGTYDQIEEGDFLEVVTKTDIVVVHFFHKEFERCKIVDKHLKILAQKYFDTKFVKLSAPVSLTSLLLVNKIKVTDQFRSFFLSLRMLHSLWKNCKLEFCLALSSLEMG